MSGRKAWVKPTLVRKPVQETLAGNATDYDGQGGEQPIQS